MWVTYDSTGDPLHAPRHESASICLDMYARGAVYDYYYILSDCTVMIWMDEEDRVRGITVCE